MSTQQVAPRWREVSLGVTAKSISTSGHTGPGWSGSDHPVDAHMIDYLVGGAGAPYRFQ